jgi:hypothetical protein
MLRKHLGTESVNCCPDRNWKVSRNVCYAIKGIFASDSGIIGDPIGDFASSLLVEMPTGSAPILALSSGMPSRDAMDVVINWFEENHIAGSTTVVGAVASTTATSVTVADASQYPPGVILQDQNTGEFFFVTGIVGNVLTIVRGFAGTTAVNIGNGDVLQRIGTAQEEGSNAPVAIVNLGSPLFNYTQIFRNTWNVTGTAKAVQYHTGNQTAKTQRDAAVFHAEDIERSLMFGRRSLGVKNNLPFRTMNGLDAQITTNVTAAGGTTSWTQLDAFLQTIFSRNIKGKPNERIAFTGNAGLSVLNSIARLNSQTFIEPGQTDFGINVNKWITPFGTISLMTHPLMTENATWSKDLKIYHPGAIETRWLRRTHEDDYDRDGSRAGVDADYGVFTSELSIEYHIQRTGGRLTGLTAGAAG